MGVIIYHSYSILIAPRVNLPSGHDHIEKTKWACIGPRLRYKYGEGTQGCTDIQLKYLCEIRHFRIARGVTLGYHINFILHTESRFQGSKVQPLGSNLCTTASVTSHDGPGSWYHPQDTPKALYSTLSQISTRSPPSNSYLPA